MDKTEDIDSKSNVKSGSGESACSPPELLGFCDECNSPIFEGVSHLKTEERYGVMDKWCWAWVLSNVLRYDEPVAYAHPQGAVIWVSLPNVLLSGDSGK